MVLYGLLNGFLPFDIDDDEPTYALYEKIKVGESLLFKFFHLTCILLVEFAHAIFVNSTFLFLLRYFNFEQSFKLR